MLHTNNAPLHRGTVKFFDAKRMYGMATIDEPERREIFIMHKSLSKNYVPVENDTIEFEIDITIRSSGSQKLETKHTTLVHHASSPTATATPSTALLTSAVSTSSNSVDQFSVVQATSNLGTLTLNKSTMPTDPFSVVQASTNTNVAKSAAPNKKSKRRTTQKKKQHSGESKKQQSKQSKPSTKSKTSNKKQANNRAKRSNASNKLPKPANTPDKFAESTMFQSPDPSKICIIPKFG
jgi:hypothetical protein